MMLLDKPTWQSKFFSNGWVAGEGGDRAVVEPATGSELGRVGVAGPGDVAAAARAAAAAQVQWAALPHPARAAVLRRAGDLWQENADEVRDWIVRETGAVPPKGDFEIGVATQECYEAAALPSRPYGELLPSLDGRLSMSRRVPAGVVGVISPFNFPLILSIRSVAPALALGNAVLLKPDPRTAISGGLLLAGIFAQAGLPEGLLHVLPGGPELGEAIIAEPRVRVVSFTGSTRAGRRVGQVAAANLTRVHLELGGNSALVVLDDADLDRAISAGAWGSFNHQGQICMTTGRHLVHESLYDEYVERLAKKADALELGPVIDAGQRDKIHALVSSSVDAGARLAAGGTFTGLFYRPTVLADVRPDMPAYAEEVFGPVAPVARFGSLDEAAALASGSEYGLSLGIITRDVTKGLALADRIPTGIVHINDQTVNDEANVPFGGMGASGTGVRFGGAAANVEAFTETRWVTVRGDVPQYPF
jgi:benzaldehyde dehydrogenase (NAD)